MGTNRAKYIVSCPEVLGINSVENFESAVINCIQKWYIVAGYGEHGTNHFHAHSICHSERQPFSPKRVFKGHRVRDTP